MSHKLGRLTPHDEATHPRLHLGHYLPALPTPPASADWHTRVTDWPMYLNDQLGDCTEAMVGHLIEGASTYGQGNTVEIGDSDVLTAYERVSGYNPADPATDQGAVLQDVYTDWRKTGVGGHKVMAFAQVDHTADSEWETAVAVFGAVGLGIIVTQDMMNDFDAGRPWTRASGAQLGGHAVPVVGYDADNLYVVTWGAVQAMSRACFRAVAEEAWVAVLPEWLDASGHAPSGVDLYQLGEDLAALTGGPNPFPAPTPPAPPAPEPVPSPTPDCWAEFAALLREACSGITGWLDRHGL
ncbi:cysteine peptidase family C39 domain-containing protein [Actinomadura harenae]|uniref:Peptidase C39-like domain-containing protein n=1 Tax=Actinomadura harenae TaxID=2483351 RepID=A0A3M2MDH2_9ACTN|nr:hypothetical protein [Actinomadura harenae]RMI47617.1 hypothetical protein EBO15_01565 [Actinomadura harenae]